MPRQYTPASAHIRLIGTIMMIASGRNQLSYSGRVGQENEQECTAGRSGWRVLPARICM